MVVRSRPPPNLSYIVETLHDRLLFKVLQTNFNRSSYKISSTWSLSLSKTAYHTPNKTRVLTKQKSQVSSCSPQLPNSSAGQQEVPHQQSVQPQQKAKRVLETRNPRQQREDSSCTPYIGMRATYYLTNPWPRRRCSSGFSRCKSLFASFLYYLARILGVFKVAIKWLFGGPRDSLPTGVRAARSASGKGSGQRIQCASSGVCGAHRLHGAGTRMWPHPASPRRLGIRGLRIIIARPHLSHGMHARGRCPIPGAASWLDPTLIKPGPDTQPDRARPGAWCDFEICFYNWKC